MTFIQLKTWRVFDRGQYRFSESSNAVGSAMGMGILSSMAFALYLLCILQNVQSIVNMFTCSRLLWGVLVF